MNIYIKQSGTATSCFADFSSSLKVQYGFVTGKNNTDAMFDFATKAINEKLIMLDEKS